MELYWLWLSLLGEVTLRQRLLALGVLETPKALFYASAETLCAIPGLTRQSVEALLCRDLTAAKRVQNECYEKGIRVLPMDAPDYPELLRSISDPPLLLYVRGSLPKLSDELTVAVVGHRKPSANGLDNARRLGYELSRSGAIVVSGAAAGIDATAMEGALRGNQPVIAVLGCGVDVVYPRSSRKLLEDVRDYGCILSEYPPGTKPEAWHFPVRNRILSGLCRAVLVVEAPRKSGSLITAKCALEQGRDVFAVPGNAGLEVCAGSNDLLRQGAYMAEFGNDIIGAYAYLFRDRLRLLEQTEEEAKPSDQSAPMAASPVLLPEAKNDFGIDNSQSAAYIDVIQEAEKLPESEGKVLRMMSGEPLHIDRIIEQLELPTPDVMSALTMLEIRRLIRALPGGNYVLAQRENV